LLVVTVLGGTEAQGIGFPVDGFQQAPFSITTTSGTNGTGAELPQSDSLGGRRSVTLFQANGGSASMSVVDGVLRGSNTAGSTNVTVGYGWRYTGGGAGLTGLTTDNLNISILGTDRIRFQFTELTGFVRILATLSTDTPNGAGQGVLSNANAGNPAAFATTPGTFDLLLSDLRVPNNAQPLDFRNVDRVVFVLQLGPQASFALDSIGFNYVLVPEPGSAGLILGLSSLLLARRRVR
jgi:hypothetical protein